MNEIIFHKTRIAPTPSGFLHLGNAYSFLLTQYIAEKANAKILLRIDDLDAQRMRPEYVQDIFDTLNYLEIEVDEGPRDEEEYELKWSQQHRKYLYDKLLIRLWKEGLLFACQCSRTDLQLRDCDCRSKNISPDEKDTAWRLITDDETVILHRYNAEPIVLPLPESMKNFIVRKKDGEAAYQLSSVADDVHFDIDLIIRGEDLFDSTLAQLYLAQKAGLKSFSAACFYHHELLNDGAGEKLSKSAGALSLKELRKTYPSVSDLLKNFPLPSDLPVV